MEAITPASERLSLRIRLLAIGTFAIGTDAFVIAGILPVITAHLHVSSAAAGQVVTVYAATYGLASPLLAAAMARFSGPRIAPAALALFAVANALSALSGSFELLLATRVLAGVSAALYTPTAYALAAAAAPSSRRGAALAAVALGLTGATVLGVPLGAAIGSRLGWQATFWLITALATVAAVALSVLPVSLVASMRQPAVMLRSRLAPLTRGPTLLALLPGFLWSSASFVVYTYVSVLLRASGYGPTGIIAMLLAYGVGGLIGNQLGGRLCDRFGWLPPIVVSLLVQIIVQLLLSVLLSVPIAAAALFLVWPLAGWATWAPQQMRLMAFEPSAGNVVLALGNSAVYVASAAGAALGGIMLTLSSVFFLPLLSVLLLVLALVFLLIGETKRPVQT